MEVFYQFVQLKVVTHSSTDYAKQSNLIETLLCLILQDLGFRNRI